MTYQDALADAINYATIIKKAVLVVYFPRIDSYGPYGLDRFVQDGNDNGYQIAASVDHHGIITESKWVKEQLGLAEVAA
jgi:hypothetical protein